MLRRIKRNKFFELTLQISDDDFIKTPKESQRNWLLNRVIKECSDDLLALNELAAEYIRGGDSVPVSDRTHARLEEQEIMEDWQIPLMQEMVNQAVFPGKDILEIGFGRGISSSMIQSKNVKSHTIVECNNYVIEGFNQWKKEFPGNDIRMIEGKWQDVENLFELYDGIFFHTYPLTEEDFVEQVSQSVTFSEHFFPTAVKHLKPGGLFTYFTNESDSLSRAHQRLLLEHFSSFTISQIHGLDIPQDTRDAHWTNEMVIVVAKK